jgi:hypothetical protein
MSTAGLSVSFEQENVSEIQRDRARTIAAYRAARAERLRKEQEARIERRRAHGTTFLTNR